MNKLSLDEIKHMLKDSCPSEIMERESDRLDEAGLRLLGQETSALDEVDALLASFGKSFQDDLPPAPQINLPDQTPHENLAWFQRKSHIPNSWLSLAAVLLAGFIWILSWDGSSVEPELVDPMAIGDQVRGATVDLEGMDAFNQDIFNAYLARGIHLLDVGSKNSDANLFQLALNDFEAAYLLNSKHQRLLQYLARVHEKLGHEDQAILFLEKSLNP